MPPSRFFLPLFIFGIVLLPVQFSVQAQDALYLVTPDTQVKKISFKFPEGKSTFEKEQLQEQLITVGPTFWDKFDKLNPFQKAEKHPFDPIELQKDVVRLRQFYAQNGFPSTRVSYTASQFNAEANHIHVIFAIWEGQPLFIHNIRLMSHEGTDIEGLLPQNLRRQWARFNESISSSINQRFTEIERIRILDLILRWFQNNGYAFASVETESEINNENRTVDLKFLVQMGPIGYFSAISVEGNQSVSEKILLRELPFKVGERFSSAKLREGQQQLFGLNLFRVALTDLPEQPADSTVQVRIRVNESKLRYVSAETGYARREGIGFEGEWTHRNFIGSARNLSINFRTNTGLLSTTGGFTASNVVGKLPARLFRTSVSLRQPYLFTTKLSGIFSPFIEFQNDPQLAASFEFLDINRREFGLNATLIYEVLPFRPISIQYTLSKSLSRSDIISGFTVQSRDIYNNSVLGMSATFGKTNNYINPRTGYLLKPVVETAGRLFSSGIQYNKVGIEVITYIPLTKNLRMSNRLFAGKLWTFGNSRKALMDRICVTNPDNAALTAAETGQCRIYENRFDPVYFYAGGNNDVRGWDFQLLGPKIARADTLRNNGAVVTDENGDPVLNNFFYERTGGTAKLIGNIEVRSRIPGFGPAWQGATFFDFGQIANNDFRFKNFKYNIGAGIRYLTIVGFIRLDIAYKLNPSNADLTDPEEVFLYQNGLQTELPEKKLLRRFGIHISIGQAF